MWADLCTGPAHAEQHARSLAGYISAGCIISSRKEREKDIYMSLLILYTCICIGPTREKFVEIAVSSKIRTHRVPIIFFRLSLSLSLYSMFIVHIRNDSRSRIYTF